MLETIKTIRTENGFALVNFGECPQMMIFEIGHCHTFMYDGLCNNVELFHKQHEAYRNNSTKFSVILETVKEAIDQYCHPLQFDTLPTECKDCIYDAIERC